MERVCEDECEDSGSGLQASRPMRARNPGVVIRNTWTRVPSFVKAVLCSRAQHTESERDYSGMIVTSVTTVTART